MSTADRAAVAAVMQRFFDSVSFDEGGAPTYERIRDLVVPGGLLTRAIDEAATPVGVDDFIAPRRRMVEEGSLIAFEERELADITEIFGNVAHRLSTYAKRTTTPDGTSEQRGVISTQFIRTREGWRMTSMAWDDERAGLSLPAAYEPPTRES